VTAIGLLALPALLVAPSGTPLDADVFDASALPTVVFDVVAPRDFAAVELTSAMFQVEGGTVTAVTEVDPATVAVSLVIDDSPTLTPAAVNEGQGASVELVRNTGDGTQISLSTPSGMQTALTTDRDANIARISGIVAGSPDVVKLPDLLVDAARRLAAAPLRDRHLVAVLGTTVSDGPQLQALRDIVIPAGIRLDVVAAPGVEVGPIAGLAVESGGIDPVLPKPVAEIDAVTQAIRDRYRVTATVDGAGEHDVSLAIGGQTFGAELDVPTPPPPPTSAAAPPTTATTAQGAVPAAPTTAAVATPVAATTTPASTSEPSGLGRGARILIVLLTLVAVAGFGVFFVSNRRAAEAKRRRNARAAARALAATAEAATTQSEVEASATPVDGRSDVPPVVYWERRREHRRPTTSDVQPVIRWNRRRADHRELPPFEPPLLTPDAAEPAEHERLLAPARSEAEFAVIASDTAPNLPLLVPRPEPVQEESAAIERGAPPAAARTSGWAARRARKRTRRELAAAMAAAAAVESQSSSQPEPEPVAVEPEPVAVEPEPEPVAVEPEPEPVAVEPEPEPVAVEPEPEPVAVEPEPESEPVAVEPEPAAPEPELEPVSARPEPTASEPEASALDPGSEPIATPPTLEPAVTPPEPEPSDETLTVTAATAPGAVAAVDAQPLAPRRGRGPNDRARRRSVRQVAPEEPQPAEEPDPEPPARRGRRRTAAEPAAPTRTRRGSPADLPKRARTRRRFDDIPLIESAPEAAGDERPADGAEAEWLESGELRMCPSTGTVIANGREVSLTTAELGVLELLLTSGNEGVTPEAIKAAAGATDEAADEVDPDAIVVQLRRKTGLRGRNSGMRKERVLLYFFGEDEGSADA
jgi:hypothetical protein